MLENGPGPKEGGPNDPRAFSQPDLNVAELKNEELDEVIETLESLLQPDPLEYIPHEKQLAFHKSGVKYRLMCGGNRSGKTEAGTLEDIYHATGIYPIWYPNESKLKVANRGRVIVTDYKKGAAVFEEKLLKYLPPNKIVSIKRTAVTSAIEKILIRHVSGGTSVIELLTHEQDDNVFEGWSGHWAHFDEPPPYNKFIATVRGLIDFGGRCWLTLTPISEPWLYDEFISKEDINVFYINIDIRDNTRLKEILGPEKFEFELKDFESKLTEDQKEARLHGRFKHLIGLVYKEFDPSVHCILESKIKIDPKWPVYFACDPHDRKPHFGIWARVDPFGTIYLIQEIKFKGTIKEFSKEILKREILNGINSTQVIRVLDPNKGETPTAVTGLKLKEEFAKCGIYFITSVNDDVTMGHLAVAERLRWDKSKPLSLTNTPKMFWIKENTKECVSYFQRYTWEEWKDSTRSQKEKPKDNYKDYPDVVRYLVMFNPVFYTPEMEREIGYDFSKVTGY